jgi:hypothetical protein
VSRESLVWNIRLKVLRGVRVAGSGVGLLDGQTTKRDSIASVEGDGVFTVKKTGTKERGLFRQVGLGHVPKVFREPIRGFHD